MPSNMDIKLDARLVDIIKNLYDVGGLKFGDFVMKSGRNSPVYVDLRVIISHPSLLEAVALLMWDKAETLTFNTLCGVPYNALPIATLIAVKHKLPMLIRRKEIKRYGTKKLIEGKFSPGDKCVIIEDVITTGSSILETVKDLRHEGLVVTDAIVIVNREQGGLKILEQEGITVHSLCSLIQVIQVLEEFGRVEDELIEKVKIYLSNNQVSPNPTVPGLRLTMSFEARANMASSPVAQTLFRLMAEKKSNLCVAADVSSSSELVSLAKEVGPHICLLKTHADIVSNFTPEVADELIDLATQMKFMILEDRKFADIGHTVAAQYGEGSLEISRWADLVTAHALPGEGLLKGLEKAASMMDASRGCFLLAEMSCEGNLITPDYAQCAVQMAKKFPLFVAGFVGQSSLASDCPGLIQLTPGVRRSSGGDMLGQQWVSSEVAVLDRGADIVVVGRGITSAKEKTSEAQLYRKELWDAYLQRIGHK